MFSTPASICFSGPNELLARGLADCAFAAPDARSSAAARDASVPPSMRRRSWLTASDMATSSCMAAPENRWLQPACPKSPRLVRMKDVVLRFHHRVAGVAAVGGVLGGRELAGLGVVVEHGVAPPGAVRKPLAVLLHQEDFREGVRHVHVELRLRALLYLPLQLHDLGAVGKGFAIAGNAAP